MSAFMSLAAISTHLSPVRSRRCRNSPNQRIDLHTIHIIQLLQRLLDLPLVGLDIADEYQRVILLNFLHRTLRVQWVDDHLVVIETWLMGDRFSRVFWVAGQLERLWTVEGC